MKLYLTSQDIDKIPCELIVLMHSENQLPFKGMLGKLDWRVNGRLSGFVEQNRFSGKAKELLLMPSELRFKAEELIILGLGNPAEFEEAHVPEVIDFLLKMVASKKCAQLCFSLSQLIENEFGWRNAVRLLVSKAVDFPVIKEIILREPAPFIRDAKKRRLEFGPHIIVEFI